MGHDVHDINNPLESKNNACVGFVCLRFKKRIAY